MIRTTDDVQVASVRISSTSHRVRVVAGAGQDVRVDGKARVDRDGRWTTIDSVRGRLVVEVPERADVVVGTTSARVEVAGLLGAVAVVTDSGRVTVDDAASVDIRTTSARVEVGRVADDCCIRTTSGRVEVGTCRRADVTTGSGRIVLQRVDGPVRTHCVSGRIEVGLTGPSDVDAETVSGGISVTVPGDVEVHRAPDQSAVARWPDGSETGVAVRSVSGRVDVSPR